MPDPCCPVRGCGAPLARLERRLECPSRHSFDVARSGYVNLLQPDQRRSKEPGDSAEAVAARRRFLEAGHAVLLASSLRCLVDGLRLAPGAPALDVGCGEGYFAREALLPAGCDVAGTDLSRAAIEAAARRSPEATWVIANADRVLPWADGSLQLVTSITSRVNASEFQRVLAPGGTLVVAVPGAADLVELRAAVQGEGTLRERLPGTCETITQAGFREEGRLSATCVRTLTRSEAADLLASTYRGARSPEQARTAALPAHLDVTLSTDVAWFTR